MSAAGDFTELARRGGRGALVTVLSGPAAGGKMLVTADGERHAARSATRRSRTRPPSTPTS